MAASIRGHKGSFKVIQDGREVVIDTVKNFSVNQDSTFSRAFYVGNAIGEGDQTVEGWSGSMDMEVKNAVIEEFIDALINNNLNGIGVSEYSLLLTEEYSDGTSSTYAYFDMQWKLSKTMGGLTEKMTKKLDFQASGRLPV